MNAGGRIADHRAALERRELVLRQHALATLDQEQEHVKWPRCWRTMAGPGGRIV